MGDLCRLYRLVFPWEHLGGSKSIPGKTSRLAERPAPISWTLAASAGIDRLIVRIRGRGSDECISSLPGYHERPGLAPSALAGSHPVSGWIRLLPVPGSAFGSAGG